MPKPLASRMLLALALPLGFAASASCARDVGSRDTAVGSDALVSTPDAPDGTGGDAADGEPDHDDPRGSAVVAISAGESFTCALRRNGRAACWGLNMFGQLGDGTRTDRSAPVQVGGLTDAVEIDAGSFHVCARRANGAVVCWGANDEGQLGQPPTSRFLLSPVGVMGLEDAAQISAAFQYSCGLRRTGQVACWGSNATGQLGRESWLQGAPGTIDGLADVAGLSGGAHFACAWRIAGDVVCWGSNHAGQLGNGTPVGSAVPLTVDGPSAVVDVSAGAAHACAVESTGHVICWGCNAEGELGSGTVEASSPPVEVVDLRDALEVTAGDAHTCARRQNGSVVCWGDGLDGRLGNGSVSPRQPNPAPVRGLADAVQITAGTEHTCALRSTGDVVCWGDNAYGELGDGTTTTRTTPVRVAGL